MIEAAKLDGAGEFRLFLQIVLPLCKPLLAVLILLTLLSQWNDFAWPLIVLKDSELFTLPVGLMIMKGETTPNYNDSMAMALLASAPMVLLFLFFQRYFIQDSARSGIK